jgi:hypothetical protein
MDFDVKARRWLLVCGVAGCALGIFFISFALSKVEDRQEPTRPRFTPPESDLGTPLVEVNVVGAEEASEALLEDSLVIGVQLNGEARAYPLSMLERGGQSVVNDELGGVPIVVTWNETCLNARVFKRAVVDQTLDFYPAHSLWAGSLVMLDPATRTCWSQMLGKAIDGPQDGQSLSLVAADVLSWGGWQARFPETTVIDLAADEDSPTTADLHRSSELVYGATIDGTAVHWSLDMLLDTGGVSCVLREKDEPLLVLIDSESASIRLFSRRVDRKTLRFEVNHSGQLVEMITKSVWDRETAACVEGKLKGKRLTPIPGTLSDLGKWKVFYPKSISIDGRSSSQ